MPINQEQTFEKKEGKTYTNLPKGIYQVELLDVHTEENETYDSKMGKTEGVKKYQTDLSWQFTILQGRDESQASEEMKELRVRNVWENFGQAFLYIGKNGKNNLYRIAEAFLGRELDQKEEAEGVTSSLLNSFIGKQILISVEPKTSTKGKTFDNIIDYLKAQSELNPLSDEEKEKARVKTDDEKQAEEAKETFDNNEANVEEAVNNIQF